MKIDVEKTILEGYFIDEAGQVNEVSYTNELISHKYSIKRLNMKIWKEGYDWCMIKICKSSKDIELFTFITSILDEKNYISLKQSDIAKEIGVSKIKVNQFFKRMIDINLIKKENNNFFFNPFILIGFKIKKNEDKERIQQVWRNKYSEPTNSKINEKGIL